MKNIFWWCRWLSLHCLFALGFAISGALFPLLYQKQAYSLLLLIWFWTQLSGRFQACISLGFFKQYQESLYQDIHFRPEERLNNAAWIHKKLHQTLYELTLKERRLEIVCYQIIPQLLSFFLRIWVIYTLSGFSKELVGIALLTILVLYIFSHLGKKAALRYEFSLQRWHQSQYNRLYQMMHYNGYVADNDYPVMAIVNKEGIKAGIGLWVFLILWLSVGGQKKQGLQSCLLVIAWLGLSEHIWAIWQTYVEWLGLPESKPKAASLYLEDWVKTIQFKNIQILKAQPSLNLSINTGDILWVRGINGSGKTTLLKALLTGNPLQGDILINGQKRLTSSVCVLNSDMVLRNGKLKNFIAWEDAVFCGLEKAISELLDKMDTDISSLHTLWSKGMLQKLNLCWALSQQVSVFLLDEACCHIPLAEEIRFYHRMSNPERILIVVSHQLQDDFLQHKQVKQILLQC